MIQLWQGDFGLSIQITTGLDMTGSTDLVAAFYPPATTTKTITLNAGNIADAATGTVRIPLTDPAFLSPDGMWEFQVIDTSTGKRVSSELGQLRVRKRKAP